MATTYLALGTNLGDKKLNLNRAIEEIKKRIGSVIKLSAFYTSEAWGFKSENSFVNAVLQVQTKLKPEELLLETQKIEKDLGRIEKSINSSYTDRIIDIDILFYESYIINSDKLQIPHPHIKDRNFVLIPLCEIAPDFIHPTLKSSIKELTKGKTPLVKLK